MTHPITPPLELVEQWVECWRIGKYAEEMESDFFIAARAAQWGADQELEACCALLELSDSNARDFLQSARRPKPPSLKELALIHFESFAATFETSGGDSDLIRLALEQLPDCE